MWRPSDDIRLYILITRHMICTNSACISGYVHGDPFTMLCNPVSATFYITWKWLFYPFNNGIMARSHLYLVARPFNYCVNRYVIETKSIVPILPLAQPSLPAAHPVRLKAWKSFSAGVIRLGLNSPAGRAVYDCRRPVPCACHFLTLLTGWGQQPQTGSLDSFFCSWDKNIWTKKIKIKPIIQCSTEEAFMF